MLCWLAPGEHEAAGLHIPQGIREESYEIAPLGTHNNLCWLASGEHEAAGLRIPQGIQGDHMEPGQKCFSG